MDLKSIGSLTTSKIKSSLSRRKEQKFRLSLRSLVLSLLVIFLVIVIGFAVAIYGLKKDNKWTVFSANVLPYPMATVNGSAVLLKDFYFTRDYTIHFYNASKQAYNPADLNRQIADQLIDQQIVRQQAAKNKVTVSSDEVDKSYQKLIDSNGKDEVNKVLNDLYGLTETQFKQLIVDRILKQKLEAQLKQNGQWHQVQVRHLLVKVDSKADAKAIDDAKNKATDFLNQIKGGKSFEAVAKDNSEDVESKDQGGELGYLSRGQTVKEFEDAIFNPTVKKGDLIGPVRTQYGWHIIQIEDIRGDNDYVIWRGSAKINKLIKF